AIGIIAAQSIGEPGTQLTLKTFHVGGAASRVAEQTKAAAKHPGKIKYEELETAVRSDGETVALAQGRMALLAQDRHVPFTVPLGALVRVTDGQDVREGDTLFEWEPYSIPIIARSRGHIVYEDIEVGVTLREDIDERSERMQRIVVEDRDKVLHPRLIVAGAKGKSLERHALPVDAYLVADDKQEVVPGDTLARLVREMARTRDITGGLPKVAELFEAKRVREPAVISEIDGSVDVGEPKEGIRLVRVLSDGGAMKEYEIPYGKYMMARTGGRVRAGDKLCEGSVDPHTVLSVKGWLAVQEFLTNQIQAVYRLQKVKINDKHISIIVRQMLRKVKIEDAGDSSFTEGEVVERRRVLDENEKLLVEGLRPASYQPILLGITRAALLTESFLSAASFQETTRVLSEAAIAGREDKLKGLKENVIVGRLVPAGTGFREFSRIKLVGEEKPTAEAPAREPAAEAAAAKPAAPEA
ncbi:DNA-directed RNA polymerase subunit beta', partial [candidate division WOR-3 bacterium]|nr:DNA-directed RNA polymerase subunit beta' [candidate division WOR-3 bacterium]